MSKLSKSTGVGLEDRPDTNVKYLQLNEGHIIQDKIRFTTVCGLRVEGWIMGTARNVTCKECQQRVVNE